MAVALLAGTVQAGTGDPLDMLQDTLRQMFPRTAPPAASAALTDPDPLAIVDRQFLRIHAPDLPPFNPVGVRRIREYPPALLRAHAACVKIITPFWQGAGVVVSPEGDVLTSYHLLAGVPGATAVTLDGRIYSITNVQSVSALHDLALLKVAPPPSAFLSPDARPSPAGDRSLAIIGHPGESSWRMTTGQFLRQHAAGSSEVIHFQADIGRGNSGGPILDANGNLRGLTACAATLADGSLVKVGVSLGTLRHFLAQPRRPVSFTQLAIDDRNRRMAEVLADFYPLMAEWMHAWSRTMADARVTPSPVRGGGVRIAGLDGGAELSGRLIVIKAFLAQCANTPDLEPRLCRSINDGLRSVDAMIDCASTLRRAGGSIPEAMESLRVADRERETALLSLAAARSASREDFR